MAVKIEMYMVLQICMWKENNGNLKFFSDDPQHSLDGTKASHKLLLRSVHLVAIIIIIIIIIVIIMVIIILIVIITSIILTWQARLLRRKMPAR